MARKTVPSNDAIINELLDLYRNLLIPFMKIRRDIWFPTEPEREETDGEHAYTLSMLAITLSERMQLGLDTGLIAKYALVHDLVEVHAGDTSARADAEKLAKKAEREKEAFMLIKTKYLKHAPWIAEYIERYENRADEESKFVYSTDKLMGALAWLAGDGARWASNYPKADGSDYHRVVEVLRKKAKTYPKLLDIFEAIHIQLDQKRPLFHQRSQGEVYKRP